MTLICLRKSLLRAKDILAFLRSEDLGVDFLETSSWNLVFVCFILKIKGTNWAFTQTINFLVVSSIHARRTMRSYLLILRRGLRHKG